MLLIISIKFNQKCKIKWTHDKYNSWAFVILVNKSVKMLCVPHQDPIKDRQMSCIHTKEPLKMKYELTLLQHFILSFPYFLFVKPFKWHIMLIHRFIDTQLLLHFLHHWFSCLDNTPEFIAFPKKKKKYFE